MTIEEQIEETLEKIRPFILRDGGNVEFDSFVDGIVYIRMEGACSSCGLLDSTLSGGIEVILMEEVPGVFGVRLAEEKPQPLPAEISSL
jgi:Fe-S cluster biogenesis protein NfuA